MDNQTIDAASFDERMRSKGWALFPGLVPPDDLVAIRAATLVCGR